MFKNISEENKVALFVKLLTKTKPSLGTLQEVILIFIKHNSMREIKQKVSDFN